MKQKRLLDLVVSLVALVILLPLLLVVCAVIKIDSSGPIFFTQERIGLNGKIFSLIKFRTMVDNAENLGTGLFSYEDDFRITKVGHILRKSSIDELPQLINVILGQMSVVGPRPIVTYEYGDFNNFDKFVKKRFSVKPGITGLAQISGRNELTWPEKVKLDNQYVDLFKKQGVLEDFKILCLTIMVVLQMNSTIEKK